MSLRFGENSKGVSFDIVYKSSQAFIKRYRKIWSNYCRISCHGKMPKKGISRDFERIFGLPSYNSREGLINYISKDIGPLNSRQTF